jgi:hypothetical protein
MLNNSSHSTKEKSMKKSLLSVALTMICLLGLGEGARAEDRDKVVSNVPFEFVVGGVTLPAGVYTLGKVSPEALGIVLIRSQDKGALLLPIAFDEAPAGRAEFDFEHVGDRYFLSKVETPQGVYIFRTPRAMTKVAQVKDHGTVTYSGGAD